MINNNVKAKDAAKKASSKVPPEITARAKSIYVVLLGLSMVIATSIPAYKRFVLGEKQKVQQGEILPNGEIRLFDEYEKKERANSSLLNRIFGSSYK